jgi:hypothetical protein
VVFQRLTLRGKREEAGPHSVYIYGVQRAQTPSLARRATDKAGRSLFVRGFGACVGLHWMQSYACALSPRMRCTHVVLKINALLQRQRLQHVADRVILALFTAEECRVS